MNKELVKYAQKDKPFFYFHNLSITDNSYKLAKNLSEIFDIVFYSYNTSNIKEEYAWKYVAAVEGKKLPFYAVQFHPEMSIYEWGIEANHEEETIAIHNHFGQFFVEKARYNFH